MPWQEIHIKTTRQDSDSWADRLSTAGAAAVTFRDGGNQPVFEPAPGETKLWDTVIVIGLFDADTPESLLADLEQAAVARRLAVERHVVPDQPWERAWMDHFTPQAFGKRLWICPSWKQPPRPDAVNILLDPGVAFGTGTHATTALCLRWLDGHDCRGQRVVDYGCGSGILGIAAARLGAAEVEAVDHDPQAICSTIANARKNAVHCLDAVTPENFSKKSCDLLLANILSRPLIRLAPLFGEVVRPGGQAVLSGITSDQQDEIIAAYAANFQCCGVSIMENWARIDLIRLPRPVAKKPDGASDAQGFR